MIPEYIRAVVGDIGDPEDERPIEDIRGADAPSRLVKVTHDHHHVPADTGDPLTDLMRDVWIDSGTSEHMMQWWKYRIAELTRFADALLRDGKRTVQGTSGEDLVAAELLRMVEAAHAARSQRYVNTDRVQKLPPRTWVEFRTYFSTALRSRVNDLMDRVTDANGDPIEVAAPWERDEDGEGGYWSPATPDNTQDGIDSDALAALVHDNTNIAERELLALLWKGHTATSVADELGIGREAAKRRIARLRAKLQPILTLSGFAPTNVPKTRGLPLTRVEGGYTPEATPIPVAA